MAQLEGGGVLAAHDPVVPLELVAVSLPSRPQAIMQLFCQALDLTPTVARGFVAHRHRQGGVKGTRGEQPPVSR